MAAGARKGIVAPAAPAPPVEEGKAERGGAIERCWNTTAILDGHAVMG